MLKQQEMQNNTKRLWRNQVFKQIKKVSNVKGFGKRVRLGTLVFFIFQTKLATSDRGRHILGSI